MAPMSINQKCLKKLTQNVHDVKITYDKYRNSKWTNGNKETGKEDKWGNKIRSMKETEVRSFKRML